MQSNQEQKSRNVWIRINKKNWTKTWWYSFIDDV